jgi:predicted DNA-binding transcriptional regulator YafY
MFEFIKMLYNGDVEFKKVIDHFSNGDYDGTSNTHVTLNKYLNALKIFGVKIKKIHGKYKMLSPLYKIKLDLSDVKSVNIMKEACRQLPEGKNRANCEEFLRAIEIRYDEAAQSLTQIADNTQNLNLAFYHSEMVEQVKQCEKFCQDKLKLEVIYFDEKGHEFNLLCSPLEQVYKKRKICLKVLGNNGSRVYEIPIDNIKSIKQLPSAATTTSIPVTIVFRIKDRLAKNYKMREWERLEKIEADGSRIIVNKDEDLNQLIKRLMRYGKDCEIISPKFFKEEMIELINKTLSNYQ